MAGALGWLDERSGLKRLIEDNFFNRPLPKNLSWFRCLGGLALVTFTIQIGTGIFLMCFYIPSASGAFRSVQHIIHAVPYGWLVSKLHLVGAQIMIGCVVAHLIRVLFKGAYKRPRELHWVSGASLLMLTLLMGYTGSKLPAGDVYSWNVKGVKYEAQPYTPAVSSGSVSVAKYEVGMLPDGTKVSARRFSFIYAMHVILVPLIMCSFMGLHFLMIRRTGISEPL